MMEDILRRYGTRDLKISMRAGFLVGFSICERGGKMENPKEIDFRTAKSLSNVDLLEFIQDRASELTDTAVAVTLRKLLAEAGIFDPGSDLQAIKLSVVLTIAADIATIPYFRRRAEEIGRLKNVAEKLGLDPKWIHRGVAVADPIEEILRKELTHFNRAS
jgi:hypothetical protein